MMQGYEKTKIKVAGRPEVETERDIMLPQSMMTPHPDRVPMRIYSFDPDQEGSIDGYMRYKKGGLHSEAERVRKAGRRDDSILIHVNKDEFQQLRQQFGDPIINPQTGLPEYGFLSSLKKVIKKIAPLALSMFVTPALGSMLTGALGKVAGNAVAGSIVGGATGGKRGAITGALGSFAGSPEVTGKISSKMTMIPEAYRGTATSAALGAARGALTGDDPLKSALGAAAMGSLGNAVSEAGGNFKSPLLKDFFSGAGAGVKVAGVTGDDPLTAGIVGGGMNAASAGLQRYKNQKAMQGTQASAPLAPTAEGATNPLSPEFNPVDPSGLVGATYPTVTPINPAVLSTAIGQLSSVQTKQQALQQLAGNPDMRPVYDAMQNFTMCDTSSNFGACLAQNWGAFQASITQNAPKVGEQKSPLTKAKKGGSIRKLAVGGPGDGQDDLIPAQLTDGDFIFPADVVSALGSGSTDAGVQKLDQLVDEYGGAEMVDAEFEDEGSINALLSNGEYRIPRAVVAAIGGGSVDAGAKKLDSMMKNIRRSYRSAPVDNIPAKAKKSPLQYMKRA